MTRARRFHLPGRSVAMLLIAIMIASTLSLRVAASPNPARALDCVPPAVPTLVGTIFMCLVPGGPIGPVADLAPDTLLNRGQLVSGVHAATADQQAALARLSQKAVEQTAANHSVSASDHAAVQTWARADAQAELWGLLVEAIRSPAGPPSEECSNCRTADQQHAVDWMASMARRQGEEVAIAAGAELAKYSGLSLDGYAALFDGPEPPTVAVLQAFLDDQPLNYNSTDPSTATGGYCVYRSPAPFEDAYQGYLDPTCFTPCPNVVGCDDPMPDYEEFMTWGAAAYRSQESTAEFVSASRAVALGVGLGGVALAAVTGVTLTATLGSAMAGTAFTTAVFPFAALVGNVAGGASISTLPATALVKTAASIATSGGVGAAGVGAIAAGAILFIAGTTVRAYILFTDLAVPGKIAQAIVDSRTAVFDPLEMIGDVDDEVTLYQLFIGATLPSPDYTTCDNSLRLASVQAMCLNAPAIPAAMPSDPQFVVTTHASATSPASSTSVSPTITLESFVPEGRYTSVARLHGTWFIQSLLGHEIQTFRIRYVDWNGNLQTAWLLKQQSGAFVFLGLPDPTCDEATCPGQVLDPSTCVATGACVTGPSIRYQGPGGTFHTASVRPSSAVSWAAPSRMPYGTPITASHLNATAQVPGVFAYTANGAPVTAADGLVLGAGTHTLGVTFTPTDATLLPGGASVTLTVDQAPLRVAASSPTMTYGGTLPAIQASYTGFVNGDDASDLTTLPTCSTTATVTSGVGQYQSSCAAAAGANYFISYDAGTLTVEPAALTVSATGPIMVYGNPVPAILPTYAGWVAGDDATDVATPPTCSTVATSSSSIGLYSTTCEGAVVPNYTLSYSQGWLDVIPRPLGIVATDRTKAYGETVTFDGTEFTASGLVNGDTVTNVTLTSSGVAASAGVAGSPYAIEPSLPIGSGLDNYLIGFTAGELRVEQAELRITASSTDMIIGGSVPAITPSYAGLVAGDVPADLALAPTCATTATADSPLGTYGSSCSGAASANYDIGYVAGEVRVTHAVTVLSNEAVSHRGGRTVPIKVQLFDGTGANLSASTTVVQLASPALSPAPGTAGQPNGDFRFVATTSVGPMYQYDLATKGFPNGTYTLAFLVPGDPVVHGVQVVIGDPGRGGKPRVN